MELVPVLEADSRLFEHFDCGSEPLNRYLQRFARQNEKKGISRTYVLIESGHVIGYHCLSTTHLEFDSLPLDLSKRLPRFPVPAVRLGRLAVNQTEQGGGIGRLLLFDAMEKAVIVSQLAAVFAMVVDAKDELACHFYERHGFTRLESSPMTLYISMKSLAERIASAPLTTSLRNSQS